ncbi:MAG TPA: hypothetical protein VJ044_18095, partial [Candidatus Hodarchaeales archaeon]|nr:hypothetical protein [Candidatus Hodarchaeales archaeon]
GRLFQSTGSPLVGGGCPLLLLSILMQATNCCCGRSKFSVHQEAWIVKANWIGEKERIEVSLLERH